MKTIIRIGQVLDSRASVQTAALPPFGAAMLAQGFDAKRKEHPEAILLVENAPNGPVYITVGPNPPELMTGDRQVHAVFAPPESQEPVATFHDKLAAQRWAKATCKKTGYDIRMIDATDRVAVRANVALVVRQPDDQVLYCRIKKSKEWTIPEVALQVGETAESAARRAARELNFVISKTRIPQRVPYVNAYIEGAGHFLSIVLATELVSGEPKLPKESLYDAIMWAPAGEPPRPTFVTVSTIRRVLALSEPPPPVLEPVA